MPVETREGQSYAPVWKGDPKEIVNFAKESAKRNDPDDVLRVIDDYCWNVEGTMNVGDEKGAILDKIFKETDPTIAIELGSFLGYSAVRMARLMKPGAKLYAIEIDPDRAKLVKELVEHAGLSDKVTVITGSGETVIPCLKSKYGIERIDFVFMDHWRRFYVPDMKRFLDTKLFVPGTVVVTDNIVCPGAPDYAEFIRNHPKFESEHFESKLEYHKDVVDGLEKSTFLG